MRTFRLSSLGSMALSLTAAQVFLAAGAVNGDEPPILVRGEEPKRVNLALPDGGLPPVQGVLNLQLLRTTRDRPDLADKDGWTYAHHMDLAAWKGRLYAAWAMTPKDEDVQPYKVVYSTSSDGVTWSAPEEFFPRGLAWATRFYFYRAGSGRILALCAAKTADGKVAEDIKFSLMVREIAADHRLGEVFTLIGPLPKLPPSYETAKDANFVAACREAAANNLLLEQSDYGKFAGDRRIAWHARAPIVNGWKFGKALCFYHRADRAIVGLSKMGFAIVSGDEGKTWSAPALPPTLTAGSAKVWGQRTADGRYALVYNPDPRKVARWPLVAVQGDDGREFRAMRVVHGEFPRQRYVGSHKDPGAQYVRGLAEWSTDGSFADANAMWLIYSVHKEDVWLARVPLPMEADATEFPADDFQKAPLGKIVPGWNVYSPRWAPVSVVAEPNQPGNRCMELRDGDPYDYARAVRLFSPSAAVEARLRVKASQTDAALEVELADASGKRPFRLSLTTTGRVLAADANKAHDLGQYVAGAWMELVLRRGRSEDTYTVSVDGKESSGLRAAEGGATALCRLSVRTGPWRGLGEDVSGKDGGKGAGERLKVVLQGSAGESVKAGSDVPSARPAVFLVDDVTIKAL